jgi:hypothetical protein
VVMSVGENRLLEGSLTGDKRFSRLVEAIERNLIRNRKSEKVN